MNILELFFIAVGLSMDAFAVAICIGLTLKKVTIKKALIVGLYFGIFQAVMPLIGYLTGTLFASQIKAYDHWLAFILLGFLGGRMIVGSFEKEADSESKPEASLGLKAMLPLAVATSIDALAVGVGFAFLEVAIIPAVVLIGVSTLTLSMAGVKIGNVFGIRFKSKAEFAGGVILILMGAKILLEHLEILAL